MKKGRAGTMDPRPQSRWLRRRLFAALNVLDGTVIGRQHAAPPAPGVHPLPQHRRGAGPGAKGDPCRRRQLCDPQASRGCKKWLKPGIPRCTFPFTPTSASWLNAVEGFFAKLTKRRLKRGVFLIGCRLASRNQSLRPRTQRRTKALHMDCPPNKIIQAVRRGHQVLDLIH